MIWNEIQTRGAQKHNFELVGWYIGGGTCRQIPFCVVMRQLPLRMGVKADKM